MSTATDSALAVEAKVRLRQRVRPERVFDGLPDWMWNARGDIGMMLVRRYESLCFDGVHVKTEKISEKRIAQARKRLFSRLGI